MVVRLTIVTLRHLRRGVLRLEHAPPAARRRHIEALLVECLEVVDHRLVRKALDHLPQMPQVSAIMSS